MSENAEIRPNGDGYYLIYIGRESYPKAREALKTTGVTLDYGNYVELGNNWETHCSIAAVEGLISDTLNDRLLEQGLRVKPDMTWDELRETAEHYANDEGWTGNHEPDEEAFKRSFPHLVEPTD